MPVVEKSLYLNPQNVQKRVGTQSNRANDKLQGLAFAATGFALQMAWLSRVALLMPLLLAAAQQIQPDSPESLAQRLWEAGVTCRSGSLSMQLAKSI